MAPAAGAEADVNEACRVLTNNSTTRQHPAFHFIQMPVDVVVELMDFPNWKFGRQISTSAHGGIKRSELDCTCSTCKCAWLRPRYLRPCSFCGREIIVDCVYRGNTGERKIYLLPAAKMK